MIRQRHTPRLEATEANAIWLNLRCDPDTRVRIRPLSRAELREVHDQAGERSALAQVISDQLRSAPDAIARAKLLDGLQPDEAEAHAQATAWVIKLYRGMADRAVLAVDDTEGPWSIEGGVCATLDALLGVYDQALEGQAVDALGAAPSEAAEFLFEVGEAVSELSTLGNASSFISARRSGRLTAGAVDGAATGATEPEGG